MSLSQVPPSVPLRFSLVPGPGHLSPGRAGGSTDAVIGRRLGEEEKKRSKTAQLLNVRPLLYFCRSVCITITMWVLPLLACCDTAANCSFPSTSLAPPQLDMFNLKPSLVLSDCSTLVVDRAWQSCAGVVASLNYLHAI